MGTTPAGSIYIVEPEVFTIGAVGDSDSTITDNLNGIIANGYGFYPESVFVNSTSICGVFSKLPTP